MLQATPTLHAHGLKDTYKRSECHAAKTGSPFGGSLEGRRVCLTDDVSRRAKCNSHGTLHLRAHGGEVSQRTDSTIRDWFFENQHGLKLEVKSLEHTGSDKPVLLFIHGAGHGAWCWQEYFMPYFHDKGFTSHAISLRGQGKSSMPSESKSGGTLDDHSDDISFFIKKKLGKPPIMVGHSFGGLISQAYILRSYQKRQPLQAVALLAAAPPIGSNPMIKRFFTQRPMHAIMLTWSFINKSYLKNVAGAKRLFFSESMPDETAQRFLELLQQNRSKCPAVDVSKIKEVTPLPLPDSQTPPVLVMGGDADYSVDLEGLQETGDHYGVQPIILPGLAHDLMLDTKWESVAEKMLEWIVALPRPTEK